MTLLTIIDSNYICHRTKYKLQGLSTNEIATGVIYGFLESVLVIAEKFRTKNFVFCFDSARSNRRRIFPTYKLKDETRTEEEIALDELTRPQFAMLRNEVLPELGFKNIFHQVGFESDDIIASVVMKRDKREETIIVSRDHDLYQLLDYCSMWNPDDDKVYDREAFIEEFGILPEQWREVKCIAGCKGDKVPGVDRVKEKTAIKFLTGEMPKHHKAFGKIVSEEGGEIQKRNHALVVLPFEGTGEFTVQNGEEFLLSNFVSVCMRYNFGSLITGSRFDRWKSVFEMG